VIPTKPSFRLVPTLTEIVLPSVIQAKQDSKIVPISANDQSETQLIVERVLERVLLQLELQLNELIQTALQDCLEEVRVNIHTAMQSAARQAVQLAMDKEIHSKN
jgi:hypothetical protein